MERAYTKAERYNVSLDMLLDRFRKLAFEPADLLKYADTLEKNNYKNRVKYVPKEETPTPQPSSIITTKPPVQVQPTPSKPPVSVPSPKLAELPLLKKASDILSNGLSLEGLIDCDHPVKVFYELHPDGSVRGFALQLITES